MPNNSEKPISIIIGVSIECGAKASDHVILNKISEKSTTIFKTFAQIKKNVAKIAKRHSERQRRIQQHLWCCSFHRNEWILRAKALSMTIKTMCRLTHKNNTFLYLRLRQKKSLAAVRRRGSF